MYLKGLQFLTFSVCCFVQRLPDSSGTRYVQLQASAIFFLHGVGFSFYVSLPCMRNCVDRGPCRSVLLFIIL